MNTTFESLKQAIEARKQRVTQHLYRTEYEERFKPDHIRTAVYSYIRSGGKQLRPALLLFSCGAVGGEEQDGIPAAAAVEIYHTMTLVHDDIIDRDDLRRGSPTVHRDFAKRAVEELGYEEAEAEHYGRSIGLLTGDVQLSWASLLLTEIAHGGRVPPEVALALVADLNGRVTPELIAGETLDFQQAKMPIASLSEAQVLDMLEKKTGTLLDFAGRAGAAIGLRDATLRSPQVAAIATFCRQCGIAFQLQDDVLGIVGDERRLGKPVGSDLREGKRTLIVLKAFREASPAQRAQLEGILNHAQAGDEEIEAAKELLRDLGGLDYVKDMAKRHVEGAVSSLEILPPSRYKDHLLQLAEYMIERQF